MSGLWEEKMRDVDEAGVFALIVTLGVATGWAIGAGVTENSWRNKLVDKPAQEPRYLPHTWCDRTTVLPHMMFEILSQFLEKECGVNSKGGPAGKCHVNWYSEDCPLVLDVAGKPTHARDEMQTLYNWFHKDYIPNVDKCYDEWYAFVQKHEKKEWVASRVDPVWGQLRELRSTWDTPENEAKGKELFEQAQAKAEKYAKELLENMHRIVNLTNFMWT